MIPLRETIGSSDETVPRIDNNVVDGTVTTPMGLSKLEMRMREMRERFNRLASLDDQVDDHPSGFNTRSLSAEAAVRRVSMVPGISTALIDYQLDDLANMGSVATERWNKIKRVLKPDLESELKEKTESIDVAISSNVLDAESSEGAKIENLTAADELQQTNFWDDMTMPIPPPCPSFDNYKYAPKRDNGSDENCSSDFFPPRLNLSELEQHKYVEEFEAESKSQILMINRIPIEKIEQQKADFEREKAAQLEELNLLHLKKESDIEMKEKLARERIVQSEILSNKKLDEEREDLLDMMDVEKRRINRDFIRAKYILENGIKRQKASITETFGRVSVSGTKLYGVRSTYAPQPVEMKIHFMRALKDKIPRGEYLVMLSQYESLGGQLVSWSKIRTHGIGTDRAATTLPVTHEGKWQNTTLKFKDSCYALCPPAYMLKPSYVFILEMFQLRSDTNPEDRIIAWAALPMCDEHLSITTGRFRIPFIKGSPSPYVQQYRAIEKLMTEDLNNWLCNAYIEVRCMSLEELRPNDLEGYQPDKLEYNFLTREVLTDVSECVDRKNPVKSSRLKIGIPLTQGGRSISPFTVATANARGEEGYTGTGSGRIVGGKNPMSPREKDDEGRGRSGGDMMGRGQRGNGGEVGGEGKGLQDRRRSDCDVRARIVPVKSPSPSLSPSPSSSSLYQRDTAAASRAVKALDASNDDNDDNNNNGNDNNDNEEGVVKHNGIKGSSSTYEIGLGEQKEKECDVLIFQKEVLKGRKSKSSIASPFSGYHRNKVCPSSSDFDEDFDGGNDHDRVPLISTVHLSPSSQQRYAVLKTGSSGGDRGSVSTLTKWVDYMWGGHNYVQEGGGGIKATQRFDEKKEKEKENGEEREKGKETRKERIVSVNRRADYHSHPSSDSEDNDDSNDNNIGVCQSGETVSRGSKRTNLSGVQTSASSPSSVSSDTTDTSQDNRGKDGVVRRRHCEGRVHHTDIVSDTWTGRKMGVKTIGVNEIQGGNKGRSTHGDNSKGVRGGRTTVSASGRKKRAVPISQHGGRVGVDTFSMLHVHDENDDDKEGDKEEYEKNNEEENKEEEENRDRDEDGDLDAYSMSFQSHQCSSGSRGIGQGNNSMTHATVTMKLRYLRYEIFGDLSYCMWGTLRFYTTLVMFLFTFWLRLYVHYLVQYVYLQGLGTPVYGFKPMVLLIIFKYMSSSLSIAQEIGVVAAGPLGNIISFTAIVACGKLFQTVALFLPDVCSKFIACFGVATLLDPLLLFLVDISYSNYECERSSEACRTDYTSSTCTCHEGDFVKLFNRTGEEGSGITGAVLTLIIYSACAVISAFVLYEYFVYIHKDARILDLWRRIKGGPEEFFIPDDFEVSRDELYRVCFRAANWRENSRGLHGARRKVEVSSYPPRLSRNPSSSSSSSSSSHSPSTSFSPFPSHSHSHSHEASQHFVIYQINALGKKSVYRHFSMDTSGRIVELFE